MKGALQDIITRLKCFQYKNEEHIRLGVVCRVLEKLGWDIWNPQEVNTEFQAMPREDATRVDIALFMPPQLIRPAVFVEIKAHGRLLPALEAAEIQVRDYNRNNQADISVLTDGRYWRMYLSSASGEFSQKCFEQIDLLEEDAGLVDAELTLDAFLSKKAVLSGAAVEDAKKYLKRTDTERIMYDVLPVAQRDADEDPVTSLVECFLSRCNERGADCTREQAVAFIRTAKARVVSAPARGTVKNDLALPLRSAGTRQLVHPFVKAESRSVRRLQLINRRGANASGELLESGRFVVFADSIAASTTDKFAGGYRNLRALLEQERILVQSNGNGVNLFQLSRNYEFGSASAAASVFCGRQANDGEWK